MSDVTRPKVAMPAVGTPGPAPAVDTANWFVDANSLTSVDQQETNVSKGDEFYLASIAFRTTPGTTGSTSAWFHGGLVDIVNIHQGETHSIPNTMGRVPFNGVTRLGAAELAADQSPEFIGTVAVGFESDFTPNNMINNLMNEAASETRAAIAEVIEPLSLQDLADLNDEQRAALFGDTIERIINAVKPGLLRKVGLFLASRGDADDLIAAKLNVFVAVDESLAAVIDGLVEDLISPDDGVVGALRPRSYTQTYSGRAAVYDVHFNVDT